MVRLEKILAMTNIKNDQIIQSNIFCDVGFRQRVVEIQKIRSQIKKSKLIMDLLVDYGETLKKPILNFINNFDGFWVNTDLLNDDNGVVILFPKKKIVDSFYLKIGPNAKMEEVKKAFNTTKDYFIKNTNVKTERKRRVVYLNRDTRVYGLVMLGKSVVEIMNIIKKEFSYVINNQQQIRVIYTRVANKLGIPKDKRKIIRDK